MENTQIKYQARQKTSHAILEHASSIYTLGTNIVEN